MFSNFKNLTKGLSVQFEFTADKESRDRLLGIDNSIDGEQYRMSAMVRYTVTKDNVEYKLSPLTNKLVKIKPKLRIRLLEKVRKLNNVTR